MGKDTQGTFGNEETSNAQHAGSDSRVEAEGPWSRMEEMAEWESKEIKPVSISAQGLRNFYQMAVRDVYIYV